VAAEACRSCAGGRGTLRTGRARAGYFPREVFFFGFGFPGLSLPAAAARFFCFFVATDPPRLGAIRSDADVTRLAAYSFGYLPRGLVAHWMEQRFSESRA
jgi:hypothetical protein